MDNSDSIPEHKKRLGNDACGNLLEVYVQEAKQYDEGLVKSWKDDMDNTLVFSGLYSAIITAFVIESYQKLQEDPADASVTLLNRISDQLAFISNSSTSNVIVKASQDTFTPTPAAVACNILWFLSLILALCCAFLATFVQQWSRQFMQKTGRLRSSTAHARLFSFLYFGLKNFKMHTVVNLIPSMLHLSLFLFLGGLIAFLRDVNSVLTYIAVGALAMITAVYVGFTIWPVIALNSPYQTPLSPIAWRVWQAFSNAVLPLAKIAFKTSQTNISRAFVYASHGVILPILPTFRYPHYPLRPPSIWQRIKTTGRRISTSVSSVYSFLSALPVLPVVYRTPQDTARPRDLSDEVLAASQEPDRRRDAQSITWTLLSLTNDRELLPFVEALPDAIYGPYGIHDHNLHLIKALVETADPQRDIILRITSLMSNASNSWFDDQHRTRCSIACPKALWALAFMLSERRGQFDPVTTSREVWFPEHLLDALYDGSQSAPGNILGRKYAISAVVLCAIDSQLTPEWGGYAVRQFLQASKELGLFEFERTSSTLSKYLSGPIAPSFSFSYHLFSPGSLLAETSIVPQIAKEKLLPPEHIAKFDILTDLCLQLPQLPEGDIDLVLQYIYNRAEMNGWGSTQRFWNTSGSLRDLDECNIGTHFFNAMREYLYTLLPYITFSTQSIEPLLLACARVLHKHSEDANDEIRDTSQIALETMLGMRVVLVDPPEDGAEASQDSEYIRQYVEQNVLRLEDGLWTWNDPLYGEGVKTGRVVVLTIRLLKFFLLSPHDPVGTNVILDALEFILFVGYRLELFRFNFFDPGPPSLRAPGGELLAIFSEITLELCQWWTETPSDTLSHNGLNIIACIWEVWRNLKLPPSEKATRNIARAAKLMLSSESMGKVVEYKSQEASRVPAPCQAVTQCLDNYFYSERRFDFKNVLDRYTDLQSDDHSIHPQGLNTSLASNDPGDYVERVLGIP